jgi:hypothetical protein
VQEAAPRATESVHQEYVEAVRVGVYYSEQWEVGQRSMKALQAEQAEQAVS